MVTIIGTGFSGPAAADEDLLYVLWTFPQQSAAAQGSPSPLMVFASRASYVVINSRVAVISRVPRTGLDVGFERVVLSVTTSGNGQVSERC